MPLQTANFLLALGGDIGNTVPKFGVTAGEIAVLQAIHGADAIHDLEPSGEVERSHREEMERLRAVYGGASDGEGQRIIDMVYPGRGARVVETIDELGLVPEQFKAKERVEAPVAEKPAKKSRVEAPVAEKPAKKSRAKAAPAEEPDADNADAVFE